MRIKLIRRILRTKTNIIRTNWKNTRQVWADWRRRVRHIRKN